MATVNLFLFKNKVLRNGTSPIVVQVIHNRIRRRYSTGINALQENWDKSAGVLVNYPKKEKRVYEKRNLKLRKLLIEAEEIVLDFENRGEVYTADDVITKLRGLKSASLFSFTESTIENLRSLGKNGNARVYGTTHSVLKKFLKDNDVSFDEINYNWLKKFEEHLIKEGVKLNGIAHYMKTLRAICNRAIKEGVARKELYPFENFKIKTEKTLKRALTKEEIIQIRDINLDKYPAQKRARDLFMFSFYCMGISFVDIAYLKVKDIYKGRLNYSRQKTTQLYNMAIVEPALEIIRRYSTLQDKDEFVFPILDEDHPNLHELYLSQMRNNNKRLKDIAKKLELSIPLTSYVARHSWATIAKRSGIPTAVISEGLGHTTEKTTQIYLDSFENDVLDKANRIITL
ncbi:site-specific integrase [Marinifilum flexuosum]|uniref:Site-specific recombinase XerD n=1 Tax=Marinifilum flexuosum TaxID=1117708 RepID=A0A419X9B5_9BACT|nr:site-specific integrase [Marinifilum flexuosum]RKE04160.1 site-specific recombinase XerD [Marinifilum flexuosum]